MQKSRRVVVVLAFVALIGVFPNPLLAGTSTAITGPLMWWSIGVGAAGVIGGAAGVQQTTAGRVASAVGGGALAVFDPDSHTFLSGQIALTFPANLIDVELVGWFREFGADPTLLVPPVTTNGFLEAGGPYPLQPAAAGMTVTLTETTGNLIIRFDAPAGITVDPAEEHINTVGIFFRNISGSDLEWTIADGPGNFFQRPAEQFLLCQDPDGTVTSCGSLTPAFTYLIQPVPEPATWSLFGAALLVVIVGWRRGLQRNESKS